MENLYSPSTADQAQKTAKDAQKLGQEAKRDFEDAVGRGKDAARNLADEMKETGWIASGRAREAAEKAKRNLGAAAEKMTAYADDNTALVAVAAFGIGLLVGHLVSRES
jgi:ElaB/YqjD/DUF883 family membrane-anchored ribosome-binding protein